KYTHGFTRLTPSIITIAAMIVSIAMLSWAMRTLPVGTAYAVCSPSFLIKPIRFFNQSMLLMRMFGMLPGVFCGVLGLCSIS
ncbi:SMR family transporter, partial [Escherichia coli]|uniref:SMR family transporter n=1 Tax=Escherichia coli TaxID=562 RepID=UPI00387F0CDB